MIINITKSIFIKVNIISTLHNVLYPACTMLLTASKYVRTCTDRYKQDILHTFFIFQLWNEWVE